MIDITLTSINTIAFLYCCFMFGTTSYIGFNSIKGKYVNDTNSKSILFILLFFIYLLTAFNNTDYFGYRDIVYATNGHNILHLDPWYGYIAEFVHNNYLLFRIVVWGGALILIIVSAKLYGIHSLHFLVLFFIAFESIFNYGRASLAMGVYYLGIILILTKEQKFKIVRTLLGIALIIISYQFHKSMALLIPISIFLFMPLNKRMLLLILIASPLLVLGIKYQFAGLLQSGFEGVDEELGSTFSMYSQREMAASNWKGFLSSIISYSRFYILFYFITKVIVSKKNTLPKTITGLYNVVLIIMLICHSFLVLTANSYTLYYRYLYMTIIPMCLLWTALFRDGYVSYKSYFKIVKYELVCSSLLYIASSFSYL